MNKIKIEDFDFCKSCKLVDKVNEVIDEMEKDRMEQFDDYVIYLINKYLEMLNGKQTFKLYELSEYQNVKLYFGKQVVIFDHLDGLYSYCWLEEDKKKIVHIKATTIFEKYKGGYRFVDDND